MIKKILIIFTLFLLSATWAFACINDSYTVINEEMWWMNYMNALMSQIVIVSILLGVYFLFIINSIEKYKIKSKFTKWDIYNTTIKFLLVFVFTVLSVFDFDLTSKLKILLILAIWFFTTYFVCSLIDLYKNNKKYFWILFIGTILYISFFFLLPFIFNYFNLNGRSLFGIIVQILFLIFWFIILLIPSLISNNIRIKTLWISSIMFYLLGLFIFIL